MLPGITPKPEMVVHSHLFRAADRFDAPPGSPDVILPRYQTVVFVMAVFGTDIPVRTLYVGEEAGTHRYSVGIDTPKLSATSCGGVPLASSFLAA